MELRQLKGPFSAGESITFPSKYGYYYTQIGIQIPKRQPIGVPQTEVSLDGFVTSIIEDSWRPISIGPDVEINGTQYLINEKGILEFDDLEEQSFTVRFYKDMPAETVIDCCFRGIGE